MEKETKKIYKNITKKEAKEEVRLLLKELKPLLKHIERIKYCLKYLNSKF